MKKLPERKIILIHAAVGVAVLAVSTAILIFNIRYTKVTYTLIEAINAENKHQTDFLTEKLGEISDSLMLIELLVSESMEELIGSERQSEITQGKLDITRRQLSGITSSLAAMELLLARDIDERILDVMLERTVDDYTQAGIDYFNMAAYEKACAAFTKALKYKSENTTLLFFQLYSLYLNKMNNGFDEETFKMIHDGLAVLEAKGYKMEEQLVFTEEEMSGKTADMAYNISEKQKQEGWELQYEAEKQDEAI
ncbi:hypothetical protein K7I13_11015 [Brucepastera parasyntrophica]|uniref:hypothetical protein n=1 Tax=Brucepastera parasyntrophica TaxID=2880008 RepID=UPI00210D289A|nr:hypothetical protein [Brucepastera parasyntrophica]ULQ59038.1 hypothetical protein K7I13_11015 [Brucepastera parasyntrophica]